MSQKKAQILLVNSAENLKKMESSHKCIDSSSSHASSLSSNGYDICRICHCEGDAEIPLIAPCYCAGSLRFVHQACLQQWIKSSNTRNCELCKFQFIMHTKTKPFTEWEQLDMSELERRKLFCAVLFHAVALTCVVWSLYVLIDRTVEEIRNGVLEWPFWTKLIVVTIGFTGGVVFMYIQCKAYIQICQRWKAYNRVIYVQNAPPKSPTAPVILSSAASINIDGSSHSTEAFNSDVSMRPLFNCQFKPYQDNFDYQTHKHGVSDGEATSIDLKGVRNVHIFLNNDNGIHVSKREDCVNVNLNDTSHVANSDNPKIGGAEITNFQPSKPDGDHGSLSWRIEINKTNSKNPKIENSNLNSTDNYDKVLSPLDITSANCRDISKNCLPGSESNLQSRNCHEISSSSTESPVLKLQIKKAEIVIKFGGQSSIMNNPSGSENEATTLDEDKSAVDENVIIVQEKDREGKSVNIRIDNPNENFDNSNDKTPFIIDLTSQNLLDQQNNPSSSKPVQIRFDFCNQNNFSGGESDNDSVTEAASSMLLSDPHNNLNRQENNTFCDFISHTHSFDSGFPNDSISQMSLSEHHDSCI